MNLLMTAPLCDSRGKVRYFIGAQVDVSGLVKESVELESMQRLLELHEKGEPAPDIHKPSTDKKDEFQELCEMFNMSELSTVRKHGGRMHEESQDDSDTMSMQSQQPRLLLKEPMDSVSAAAARASGKLSGAYQNVSMHGIPFHFEQANNRPAVSSGSPIPIATHPLCFPFAKSARNIAVAVP
jgi:hypothetical protein